ncbi:hypothetical protein G7043_37055 [Lentzea sp. NEAU-D13]|uniref:Secreted protein n=1 Tax=Lentzea alba TaxID=2714351 RepID=A0A7C9VZA8_9PSEU|nr:hypothetical protein [Lentzea alba]NGY64536.1 hypothetical protein [Lentzea alba]
MRWPALLLALLLAFVGTSTRHDAADQQGSGLNAPVSVVHVASTASPDACWALLSACGGPRPPQVQTASWVRGAVHADATSSAQWSSRAPPSWRAPDSVYP